MREKKISRFHAGLRYWHYVYQLIDPRNGRPFYIGSGRDLRMYAHEIEAERELRSRKCDKIREVWAAGHEIEWRIVGLFRDKQQCLWWEQHLIEIDPSLTNYDNYYRLANVSRLKKDPRLEADPVVHHS